MSGKIIREVAGRSATGATSAGKGYGGDECEFGGDGWRKGQIFAGEVQSAHE